MGANKNSGKKNPTSIAPWLAVNGGKSAIEFYKNAFGAIEVYHIESPDGEVVSKLSINNAEFWLSDESPQNGNISPQSNNQVSVRMILTVSDPDALFDRALKAGAKEIYPVNEQHGWRVGRLVDPFGHHWEIGRPVGNE